MSRWSTRAFSRGSAIGAGRRERASQAAGEIDAFDDALRAASARPPAGVAALRTVLVRLEQHAAGSLERLEKAAASGPAPAATEAAAKSGLPDAVGWARALKEQCRAAIDEMEFLLAGADDVPGTHTVANGRCRTRRGRRAQGADRSAGAAGRRAGRIRLRLPLRQVAPPAQHRLQHHRPPPGRELLRPARLGSAPVRLRRHRASGGCPAKAGSPWGACSPAPARGRCCSPGAARCSST